MMCRLLFALPLLTILGCAGKPPPAEMVGKVLYKGAPVKGAKITFQAKVFDPQLNNAWTYTDQDGAFHFRGLPTGTVQVAIDPEYTNTVLIPSWQGKAGTAPYVYTPVPEKYAQLASSGLEVEIKPGPQTHDFVLE
jgi:hypothetical protein